MSKKRLTFLKRLTKRLTSKLYRSHPKYMEKVTNISSIYTSYTEYIVKKKKKKREDRLSSRMCVYARSCCTLCSLPGSSVHGIFQARILEWVATAYSRGFSDPGIKPTFLMSPALAGKFITPSPPKEAHPEC